MNSYSVKYTSAGIAIAYASPRGRMTAAAALAHASRLRRRNAAYRFMMFARSRTTMHLSYECAQVVTINNA
jgi:hypothetical protein